MAAGDDSAHWHGARSPWEDSEAASDPLNGKVINDRAVFFATLSNAARLHGVDAAHLATALRLAGKPGAPVTARLLYDTAAGLARAGYRVTAPANDAQSGEPGRYAPSIGFAL